MKKIYQIFEILTDILEHVRSIDFKCKNTSVVPSTEIPLATFLADSPSELQRLFTRISEFPVPPISLGEYFVVKISKRSF